MSKNAEKLVPRLRFPEFRGAEGWDSKTLNQITTAIFDGTHQTPRYTDNGIPFFSVENIVSGKLNKFISREDYLAATNKNKPEKGDILVTRIGNIGFSTIVDWDYEFSIYVTLAVVKKDDRFNSQFLHSFMQSGVYQAEIQSKSLLNAVPCKINMDELRKTKVLLPKPKEQKKIADCLSSIDDLINAQSQKVKNLKTHKKGLMQQLFPREGETVPRLRFPEFRDAGKWEEKTLKDACKMQAGKFVRAADIFDKQNSDLYPCYGGNGQRGFTKSFTHEGKYSLIGRQGALCGNITLANDKFHATEHAVVVSPHNGVNTEWLFYMLGFMSLNQHATGQAQPGLSVENLEKLPIAISTEEKEQQKIASCLSSIDDLITVQAQKLESLKNHKKGLMQQLFPSTEAVSE